jgi:hypothetical protein
MDDITDIVKLLLSASPIVIALLGICLLAAILLKVVPQLKIRHHERKENETWATATRVESIATRVHNLTTTVAAMDLLNLRVKNLEAKMDLYSLESNNLRVQIEGLSKSIAVSMAKSEDLCERVDRVQETLDTLTHFLLNGKQA